MDKPKEVLVKEPVPDARAREVCWYLGRYFLSGDPKDIVPVQEMDRPPSSLDQRQVGPALGPQAQ